MAEDPTDDRALRQAYLDRLGQLLEECAEDRGSRPDAFAWNARRSLETMAIVFARELPRGPLDEGRTTKHLDDLAKQAASEATRVRTHGILAIRETANRYVHVNAPDRPAIPPEDLKELVEALVKTVRWALKAPTLKGLVPPPSIAESLDVLEGKKPLPSETKRLEQEASRSQMQQELRRAQREQSELREKLQQAQAQAARAIAELEQARASQRRAEESLAWLEDKQRNEEQIASVPPSLAAAATPTAGVQTRLTPGARRSIFKPIALVAVGAGVAVLVGLATRHGGSPPAPAAGTSFEAAVPTSAPVAASSAPSSDPPPPSPKPTPAASSELRRCPDDMERVRPPTGAAEPFCFDLNAVTVKQYKECVAALGCKPPAGAHKPGSNWVEQPGLPVNFVTWGEASKYCEWKGRVLPSRLQWEQAAAAARKAKTDPPKETFEWTRDSSLGAGGDCLVKGACDANVRGDRLATSKPGMVYSWLARRVGAADRATSFRCAIGP